MNKKIFFISVVACFTSFVHIDGYGYQIRVASAFNPSSKKNQRVIGCCDYHDKTNSANKDQRAYMEAIFKRYPREECLYIVEDLSSINNNGRIACCGYLLNTCGLLGGLANAARTSQKDVDNLEYRYCRVAGVGPLLNNLNEKPGNCMSANALTVGNLYDEVMNEIKGIRRYDDGKKLNDLYARSIDGVIRSMHTLGIDQNKNQSVAAYCAKHAGKKYYQFLQELCIFDSALIDIKLMHSIVSARNKRYIVVVAGGAHINNVFDLLGRIGYKNEYSSPISFMDRQLQRSIHVQGHEATHNRPKAIDVRLIEKFMR